MNTIALLLLAAAIAFGLSKLLRLPSIPLLMLAGAALGALAKYQAVTIPEELIRDMIEIGLAVLVFTAGVELSPRRIRGQRRAVTILAMSQFITLGISGILTALFLGYDWTVALYLGCALSAIPGAIVYRLNPVSYWLARLLVKVKYIGIANLLLDRPLHPEFVQSAASPEQLSRQLLRALDESEAAAEALDGAVELRELLHAGVDSNAANWLARGL